MNEPAAFPATYIKLSTLVDGTLRVVLDVDPPDRRLALDLLDEPGVRLGVARLNNETDVVKAESPTSQEAGASQPLNAPASDPPKRQLTLPERVALTCEEVSFERFIRTQCWARGLSAAD